MDKWRKFYNVIITQNKSQYRFYVTTLLRHVATGCYFASDAQYKHCWVPVNCIACSRELNSHFVSSLDLVYIGICWYLIIDKPNMDYTDEHLVTP